MNASSLTKDRTVVNSSPVIPPPCPRPIFIFVLMLRSSVAVYVTPLLPSFHSGSLRSSRLLRRVASFSGSWRFALQRTPHTTRRLSRSSKAVQTACPRRSLRYFFLFGFLSFVIWALDSPSLLPLPNLFYILLLLREHALPGGDGRFRLG